MDEAIHFGHHDVLTILRDYHNQYSPQDSSKDKKNAETNLDGMLWGKSPLRILSEQAGRNAGPLKNWMVGKNPLKSHGRDNVSWKKLTENNP